MGRLRGTSAWDVCVGRPTDVKCLIGSKRKKNDQKHVLDRNHCFHRFSFANDFCFRTNEAFKSPTLCSRTAATIKGVLTDRIVLKLRKFFRSNFEPNTNLFSDGRPTDVRRKGVCPALSCKFRWAALVLSKISSRTAMRELAAATNFNFCRIFVAAKSEKSSKILEKSSKYSKMVH